MRGLNAIYKSANLSLYYSEVGYCTWDEHDEGEQSNKGGSRLRRLDGYGRFGTRRHCLAKDRQAFDNGEDERYEKKQSRHSDIDKSSKSQARLRLIA